MPENADLVLVTGASGYIGRRLAARLAKSRRVVGLDVKPPGEKTPGVEHESIDLTDDASVAAALEGIRDRHGGEIASVVHLAAYFDLTGEDHPLYDAVTVKGTERLLAALAPFAVDQFVYMSSMLVQAPAEPGRPIDEGSPIHGALPYRDSKLRAEAAVRRARGGMRALILRPAGVYDDGGHSAFLAQQIARIYEKRLTARVYPGRLDAGQAALHLDDLVEAVARAVERRASLPEETTILLGETDVVTYDELQRAISQRLHGEEWTTQKVSKTAAKAGAWIETEVLGENSFIRPWMVDSSDDHYELDLSRARELLDWSPRHSLRRTLPAMLEALKADPQGWYRANKLNPARIAGKKIEEKRALPSDAGGRAQLFESHREKMRKKHFDMLWVHWLVMGLGAWLAAAPFFFGSFSPTSFSPAVMAVTEDRNLWDPALRSQLTAWNNFVCGLAIVLFACFSLNPRNGWAMWANAVIGSWLLLAPVVFWTPSAAVYVNDTLVGAFVVAFTVLVPMMPGMSMESMVDESNAPPGWTYSPSTYLQRIPIVVMGLIGLLIARVLSAYQMGHIGGVWEPFFDGAGAKNGTEDIITSDVSKAWPVADAGVGAVTYMAEILMGVMGGAKRWRTMPWMVVLFGLVVVPLGVVSIYFIIIQPIAIGTYCTLCLIAAAAMLVMIPYSLDEIVAMGQFLALTKKRGRPFWRAFFRGDAMPEASVDDRPNFDAPKFSDALASALRGVTLPWTLGASVLIGVWLMFSRLIFGSAPPLADSDHLVGALVITTAVIAMAEVARPVRFLNALFGVWLIISPLVLSGAAGGGGASSMIAGALLIGLSLPRGKRSKEHYGRWDRYIV